MMDELFRRDYSERLFFALFEVPSERYPFLCKAIRDHFHLVATDSLVIGPDVLFQNYSRDGHEVGLEWDIWMGFSVTANSPDSEVLVREIGGWLFESGISN